MAKYLYGIVALDAVVFLLFIHIIWGISGWLFLLWTIEVPVSIVAGNMLIAKYRQSGTGCIFLMRHGEHPSPEVFQSLLGFALGILMVLPGPLAMLCSAILLPPASRRFLGPKILAFYERRHPPRVIDQEL